MTSIPSLPPRPASGATNANANATAASDLQTSPTADQRTVGQAEILLLVHNATVTMYPFTAAKSAAPADLVAHVAATQGSLRARGTLECYSLELHPPTPTESTLGLTMLSVPGAGAYSTGNPDEDTFQLPLTADLNVVRAGSDSDAFLVPVPTAGCVFRISVASPDPAEVQALADLLGHYTALNEPSATYRNTVALVGPSGQVVGTLADSVHLDTHLVNPDAKGPVVVSQVPAATPEAPIQWTVAEPPAGATPAAGQEGDSSFEAKLVSTSEMLGEWMIQGAGIVSSGILRGSVAVKNAGWVTPNATPMVLTPKTKGNIETAKSVSEVAVKATGAILSGAVTVAAAVGSAVAGKLQSDGRGGVVPANSTRARTVKLTSALIRSLAVLGDRASTAGRTVLKATGQGAAELIEHKYGNEAGQAAREVTSVAENMWIVYFDSKGFKRMVLLTGAKTTVHELAGKDKTAAASSATVSTASTTSTKTVAAGTSTTTQSTATSTITTGAAPSAGSSDPALLASQAMTYAATTAPKVAAAVQQHAPKVAAAVVEHGPRVAAAVASGAWALWSKVGEQLAQAQAAQAQQQQQGGAAAPGVPPRPASAAAPVPATMGTKQ